ncbi:hypothetical protein D3C74_411140 [compost metagenome]
MIIERLSPDDNFLNSLISHNKHFVRIALIQFTLDEHTLFSFGDLIHQQYIDKAIPAPLGGNDIEALDII